MKAILEFNLEDRDDKLSHIRAIKATDLYCAIHGTLEELRKIIKYSENEEEVSGAEKARDILTSNLTDYNIDIWNEIE